MTTRSGPPIRGIAVSVRVQGGSETHSAARGAAAPRRRATRSAARGGEADMARQYTVAGGGRTASGASLDVAFGAWARAKGLAGVHIDPYAYFGLPRDVDREKENASVLKVNVTPSSRGGLSSREEARASSSSSSDSHAVVTPAPSAGEKKRARRTPGRPADVTPAALLPRTPRSDVAPDSEDEMETVRPRRVARKVETPASARRTALLREAERLRAERLANEERIAALREAKRARDMTVVSDSEGEDEPLQSKFRASHRALMANTPSKRARTPTPPRPPPQRVEQQTESAIIDDSYAASEVIFEPSPKRRAPATPPASTPMASLVAISPSLSSSPARPAPPKADEETLSTIAPSQESIIVAATQEPETRAIASQESSSATDDYETQPRESIGQLNRDLLGLLGGAHDASSEPQRRDLRAASSASEVLLDSEQAFGIADVHVFQTVSARDVDRAIAPEATAAMADGDASQSDEEEPAGAPMQRVRTSVTVSSEPLLAEDLAARDRDVDEETPGVAETQTYVAEPATHTTPGATSTQTYVPGLESRASAATETQTYVPGRSSAAPTKDSSSGDGGNASLQRLLFSSPPRGSNDMSGSAAFGSPQSSDGTHWPSDASPLALPQISSPIADINARHELLLNACCTLPAPVESISFAQRRQRIAASTPGEQAVYVIDARAEHSRRIRSLPLSSSLPEFHRHDELDPANEWRVTHRVALPLASAADAQHVLKRALAPSDRASVTIPIMPMVMAPNDDGFVVAGQAASGGRTSAVPTILLKTDLQLGESESDDLARVVTLPPVHDSPVTALCVANGGALLSGDAEGRFVLWRMKPTWSGVDSHVVSQPLGHHMAIRHIVVVPELPNHVFVAYAKHIVLWDYVLGQVAQESTLNWEFSISAIAPTYLGPLPPPADAQVGTTPKSAIGPSALVSGRHDKDAPVDLQCQLLSVESGASRRNYTTIPYARLATLHPPIAQRTTDSMHFTPFVRLLPTPTAARRLRGRTAWRPTASTLRPAATRAWS